MRQGWKLGMMKRTRPRSSPERCATWGSGRLMGFIDNVAPSALEMPGGGTAAA